MSGPKDYDLVLTVERLEMIMRRLNEYRQTRAARLRSALDRAREGTRSQLAREQAAHEAIHRQALEQGRARADAIRAEALQRADALAHSVAASPPSSVAQPDQQASAAEASPDQGVEVEEQIQTLLGWKDIVVGDEAIALFCRPQADEWSQTTAKLLSQRNSSEVSLAEVRLLLDKAELLHSEAGELQAKFEARNEILRDVIDSLKEIGFFVTDPEFQDPHDPLGCVLVKAVRGNEEMTASVDLSKTIRSNWNGLEQEQCQSAFFDYVERMQAKGVKIEAHRADLRERPVLKQQGAQQLPRSAQDQWGR